MDTATRLTEERKEYARSCEGDELRCHCGSLVGRVTPNGIELKCRRCKRVLVIPIGDTRTEEGIEG